jgi:hypothetical protein
MNNLGEAFTYVFSDRDWPVKFLVGILFLFLSIIVVGIPFVTGYFLEIIRRVLIGPSPHICPTGRTWASCSDVALCIL